MTEKTEFTNRYNRLDELNRQSWYMTEVDRPFTVTMSIHSVGREREKINPDEQTLGEVEQVRQRNRLARFTLAGNMSTLTHKNGSVPYGPADMTDQERFDDAWANTVRHLENIGVNPADVRVLYPERDYTTSLSVVNVDEDPGVYTGKELVRLQKSGDFLYSYNPDIVLAARPADCPIVIMSAETPKGRVQALIHFAWRGVATGQMADMEHQLDILGVDRETVRAYITPGGQAESFRFTNYTPDGKNNPRPYTEGDLFGIDDHGFQLGDDGIERLKFSVDTPYEVYQTLRRYGLRESQICIDTTDTTSLASGTASHSRAKNQGEDNVRDLVVAQFHRTA